MLAKIYSAAVYGVDAYEVEIEVNIGPGEVKMVIVGLPDAAVKESRDGYERPSPIAAIDGRGDGRRSISRQPTLRKKDRASICRLRSE
jgi:hypothetical protein